MTITIELCAGVELQADYTWEPDYYHRGQWITGPGDEMRLYVNGEQVEIEGIMEQMLSDALGKTGSKLNHAIVAALENGSERDD